MDIEKTPTKLSDKEILDNLNEKQRRDHYIKKNFPEIYERANSLDLGSISFSEKAYIYINGKNFCKICGGKTKFKSYYTGYSTYCSKKCSMSDLEIITKRNKKSIKTNLKKWGVKNPSMSEEVKNKIRKTSMEKWGVDNYTKSEDYKKKVTELNLKKWGKEWYFQTDDYREKKQKTIEEKWNGNHPTKSESVKKKREKTNLRKWGVSNYSKSEFFQLEMKKYFNSSKFFKSIKTQKENRQKSEFEFWKNYSDHKLLSIDANELKMICSSCCSEFSIFKQLLYLRKRSDIKICTRCNPTNGKNISYLEKEVLDFIKSNYSGEIIENHKIERCEMDIYLPYLKLGFEFNGLWYHGEMFKEKVYHKNKIDFFEERGIEIFNIWEDQWKYKKEIIKSMIINKIGDSKKIWARRCQIREVSNKDCVEFLDNNHIQGSVNSKIRLGLYFNEELISLMTFGKLRKPLGNSDKFGEYELIRFCNRIGFSVVGGASKLLKRFIKDYFPKKILSYADRSYSNGKLYSNLGFDLISKTDPNYWWVKGGIRNYRYSFRKDILVKRGYDKNLSESDIMKSIGYYKLWDCGNLKFEYRLD